MEKMIFLTKALGSLGEVTISKDPKHPQKYYGYKSDGESYELTCVLDNSEDSEATKVGNLNLYILKDK